MAYLWLEPAGGEAGEWSPMVLTDDAVNFDAAAVLHRTHAGWVVIGAPGVHVNGAPLDTGIRLLRDRDELRAGGRRTFFSGESLAEVVLFPGGERSVFCPRCRLEVAPGSPAVRCPGCNVWHHQTDDMPCWTYGDHCTLCEQPTALDVGFRWTPEGL